MRVFWSRGFFPKVFGGVFGIIVVSASARAGNTEAAINAAKNAAMVSSGVSSYINKTQKYYQDLLVKRLEERKIKDPIFIMGAAAKTAREKRIDFIYRGNSYSITPNSIYVRIPF